MEPWVGVIGTLLGAVVGAGGTFLIERERRKDDARHRFADVKAPVCRRHRTAAVARCAGAARPDRGSLVAEVVDDCLDLPLANRLTVHVRERSVV